MYRYTLNYDVNSNDDYLGVDEEVHPDILLELQVRLLLEVLLLLLPVLHLRPKVVTRVTSN